MRPRLRAVAVAAALVVAAGCVSLEHEERELTFRVVHADAGWFGGQPEAVQDLYLSVGEAPDSPRIHAWWWPDADANAPTVLYLHGARWNLTGQLARIAQLHRFGFSVLAIDYRGFGKSDGDLPSEASVYEDAQVGWDWVVRHAPDPARRFIYGHSLGGAVAVDLAARLSRGDRPAARGLIIESTFTSLADMASELTHGWLPSLLLTQKFDSIEKIRRIRMPVLVVHGAEDRYVPSRFSAALYRAAPEPKKLLLIANGSHNNSLAVGGPAYEDAVRDFFGLRADGPAAAPRQVTAHRPIPQ
jgi:fermentation-respiration switch protein FrsA (DUF1100 family)